MRKQRPDQPARWISHIVVGLAAGAMVGKRTGGGGFLVAAVITAAAHEMFDAPLAGLIADLGV